MTVPILLGLILIVLLYIGRKLEVIALLIYEWRKDTSGTSGISPGVQREIDDGLQRVFKEIDEEVSSRGASEKHESEDI